MALGIETAEIAQHDVLEISDQQRWDELLTLEALWEMPPGGGRGGFPPIDDQKKYGGDRPEPEESGRHSLRDVLRFIGGALFGGNLGTKAYSSSHALPDETGTIKGGFRLHETSDQHMHQWDVASSSMPSSWIESSSRRSG